MKVNHKQYDNWVKQGFNRVPVITEVLADFDTPLSTYTKIANKPYTYLLESVQGGEKWGRYSFIGLPCTTILQVKDHTLTVTRNSKVEETVSCQDPLDYIERFQENYRAPEIPEFPRFNGGLVGYFSYDTIRYIEPRLHESNTQEDPINTPDILLMVSNEFIAFDNLHKKVHIVVFTDPATENAFENGRQRTVQIIDDLLNSTISQQERHPNTKYPHSEPSFGMSEQQFKAAVTKAKQYLVDGDAMQIVLSQRLEKTFTAPPLHLYRALRTINPSPYLYYLNLNDFHIVGSSPEILVRLNEDIVTVRPLAGTRKRGLTEKEDAALEKELLQDPKECAEHIMLIDLGRNDVGRISEMGSVKVTEKMGVERYSHVMHIVSNVEGTLKKGLKPLDVLRATLPAGTLSGTPKIRAMQIIDELEPYKRGIYGGAVGYFSWNGYIDVAIAIRTGVIKNNTLYVQAGAGIVLDSNPDAEWQECMNKAKALIRAAELVENGFENT